MENTVLRTAGLSAYFGDNRVVKDVTLSIPEKMVTTIMGPSGCGKTTLIRCFNRMHELVPDAKVEGTVFLREEDIYSINPMVVRRRIGMVFQRPNPFPTMSIYDNVIAGYKLNGLELGRAETERIVEE